MSDVTRCQAVNHRDVIAAVFDLDGDGFITRDEIRRVMASMGERLTEEEIDNMLREADADGDGRIDYEGVTSLLSCHFLSCDWWCAIRCRVRPHDSFSLSDFS